MIMIMDNDKTNKLSQLEYGAVMRHQNPLLCTMAHMAFFLPVEYRWRADSLLPTAPAVVQHTPLQG
jgi:hypothetical protein